MSLKGKTLFITGASRGIGLAIALRAARDGANVAIAAKTTEPHPKLPGTIYTAAEEVEKAGGQALPLVVDIRDEERVAAAVAETVAKFGGIDALINNASAIRLTGTLQTPPKRYDLMHGVNGRGTFVCAQACLPHLLKAENPHILTLSPPLVMDAKLFGRFPPYLIAKFTMSLFTLAWAAEFKDKVAVNSLWPRTTIATAAVEYEISAQMMKHSRKPEIMADAAHYVLTQPAKKCSGNFFIDDELLIAAGNRDLSVYDVEPGAPLFTDFFTPLLPGLLTT